MFKACSNEKKLFSVKLLILSFFRELQPENILYISVTLAVLKLLRSRLVRELQPLNIEFILVTLEVFRYSICSMEVKFSIPLNQDAVVFGL